MDLALYLVFRAILWVISLFPVGFIFRLGEALGAVAYFLLPGYRTLAMRNLRIAFPDEERSERERRQLCRRHFRRLGANMLSGLRIESMRPEKIEKLVSLEGGPYPKTEADPRELGSVLGVSHLSLWELFSQATHIYTGNTGSFVYQRLRGKAFDHHIRRTRSRRGLIAIERGREMGKANTILKRGDGVGILIDQHAGDQGRWLPFFNRLASTSPLPGILATHNETIVAFAGMRTVKAGRWAVNYTKICGPNELSAEEIDYRLTQALEAAIRHQPEDWFWVHNRWKAPKPNFLLDRYKRGIFLPPESMREPLQPFRILLRSPNWLGDAVMSAPAMEAFRRGRPDAHVTILSPEKLAGFWREATLADEVIAISPDQKKPAQVAKRIREAGQFDVAVLFPNSLRSALEVFLAGIPRRIGFPGHNRRWFLNQIIPERERKEKPGPPEHHAEKYLRLAKRCGAKVEGLLKERLSSSPRSAANGESRIILGLCPGAEYGATKRWFPERFAELAARIAELYPEITWRIFGVPKDTEIGAMIEGSLPAARVENLIGQTNLEGLIHRLRECRLLVSNDTGTMHLAGWLGVPTIALFGSTEPSLTRPPGRGHRIIRHHIPCSPCFLRECPFDMECMKAITVSEVTAAVAEVLAEENATQRTD